MAEPIAEGQGQQEGVIPLELQVRAKEVRQDMLEGVKGAQSAMAAVRPEIQVDVTAPVQNQTLSALTQLLRKLAEMADVLRAANAEVGSLEAGIREAEKQVGAPLVKEVELKLELEGEDAARKAIDEIVRATEQAQAYLEKNPITPSQARIRGALARSAVRVQRERYDFQQKHMPAVETTTDERGRTVPVIDPRTGAPKLRAGQEDSKQGVLYKELYGKDGRSGLMAQRSRILERKGRAKTVQTALEKANLDLDEEAAREELESIRERLRETNGRRTRMARQKALRKKRKELAAVEARLEKAEHADENPDAQVDPLQVELDRARRTELAKEIGTLEGAQEAVRVDKKRGLQLKATLSAGKKTAAELRAEHEQAKARADVARGELTALRQTIRETQAGIAAASRSGDEAEAERLRAVLGSRAAGTGLHARERELARTVRAPAGVLRQLQAISGREHALAQVRTLVYDDAYQSAVASLWAKNGFQKAVRRNMGLSGKQTEAELMEKENLSEVDLELLREAATAQALRDAPREVVHAAAQQAEQQTEARMQDVVHWASTQQTARSAEEGIQRDRRAMGKNADRIRSLARVLEGDAPAVYRERIRAHQAELAENEKQRRKILAARTKHQQTKTYRRKEETLQGALDQALSAQIEKRVRETEQGREVTFALASDPREEGVKVERSWSAREAAELAATQPVREKIASLDTEIASLKAEERALAPGAVRERGKLREQISRLELEATRLRRENPRYREEMPDLVRDLGERVLQARESLQTHRNYRQDELNALEKSGAEVRVRLRADQGDLSRAEKAYQGRTREEVEAEHAGLVHRNQQLATRIEERTRKRDQANRKNAEAVATVTTLQGQARAEQDKLTRLHTGDKEDKRRVKKQTAGAVKEGGIEGKIGAIGWQMGNMADALGNMERDPWRILNTDPATAEMMQSLKDSIRQDRAEAERISHELSSFTRWEAFDSMMKQRVEDARAPVSDAQKRVDFWQSRISSWEQQLADLRSGKVKDGKITRGRGKGQLRSKHLEGKIASTRTYQLGNAEQELAERQKALAELEAERTALATAMREYSSRYEAVRQSTQAIREIELRLKQSRTELEAATQQIDTQAKAKAAQAEQRARRGTYAAVDPDAKDDALAKHITALTDHRKYLKQYLYKSEEPGGKPLSARARAKVEAQIAELDDELRIAEREQNAQRALNTAQGGYERDRLERRLAALVGTRNFIEQRLDQSAQPGAKKLSNKVRGEYNARRQLIDDQIAGIHARFAELDQAGTQAYQDTYTDETKRRSEQTVDPLRARITADEQRKSELETRRHEAERGLPAVNPFEAARGRWRTRMRELLLRSERSNRLMQSYRDGDEGSMGSLFMYMPDPTQEEPAPYRLMVPDAKTGRYRQQSQEEALPVTWREYLLDRRNSLTRMDNAWKKILGGIDGRMTDGIATDRDHRIKAYLLGRRERNAQAQGFYDSAMLSLDDMELQQALGGFLGSGHVEGQPKYSILSDEEMKEFEDLSRRMNPRIRRRTLGTALVASASGGAVEMPIIGQFMKQSGLSKAEQGRYKELFEKFQQGRSALMHSGEQGVSGTDWGALLSGSRETAILMDVLAQGAAGTALRPTLEALLGNLGLLGEKRGVVSGAERERQRTVLPEIKALLGDLQLDADDGKVPQALVDELKGRINLDDPASFTTDMFRDVQRIIQGSGAHRSATLTQLQALAGQEGGTLGVLPAGVASGVVSALVQLDEKQVQKVLDGFKNLHVEVKVAPGALKKSLEAALVRDKDVAPEQAEALAETKAERKPREPRQEPLFKSTQDERSAARALLEAAKGAEGIYFRAGEKDDTRLEDVARFVAGKDFGMKLSNLRYLQARGDDPAGWAADLVPQTERDKAKFQKEYIGEQKKRAAERSTARAVAEGVQQAAQAVKPVKAPRVSLPLVLPERPLGKEKQVPLHPVTEGVQESAKAFWALKQIGESKMKQYLKRGGSHEFRTQAMDATTRAQWEAAWRVVADKEKKEPVFADLKGKLAGYTRVSFRDREMTTLTEEPTKKQLASWETAKKQAEKDHAAAEAKAQAEADRKAQAAADKKVARAARPSTPSAAAAEDVLAPSVDQAEIIKQIRAAKVAACKTPLVLTVDTSQIEAALAGLRKQLTVDVLLSTESVPGTVAAAVPQQAAAAQVHRARAGGGRVLGAEAAASTLSARRGGAGGKGDPNYAGPVLYHGSPFAWDGELPDLKNTQNHSGSAFYLTDGEDYATASSIGWTRSDVQLAEIWKLKGSREDAIKRINAFYSNPEKAKLLQGRTPEQALGYDMMMLNDASVLAALKQHGFPLEDLFDTPSEVAGRKFSPHVRRYGIQPKNLLDLGAPIDREFLESLRDGGFAKWVSKKMVETNAANVTHPWTGSVGVTTRADMMDYLQAKLVDKVGDRAARDKIFGFYRARGHDIVRNPNEQYVLGGSSTQHTAEYVVLDPTSMRDLESPAALGAGAATHSTRPGAQRVLGATAAVSGGQRPPLPPQAPPPAAGGGDDEAPRPGRFIQVGVDSEYLRRSIVGTIAQMGVVTVKEPKIRLTLDKAHLTDQVTSVVNGVMSALSKKQLMLNMNVVQAAVEEAEGKQKAKTKSRAANASLTALEAALVGADPLAALSKHPKFAEHLGRLAAPLETILSNRTSADVVSTRAAYGAAQSYIALIAELEETAAGNDEFQKTLKLADRVLRRRFVTGALRHGERLDDEAQSEMKRAARTARTTAKNNEKKAEHEERTAYLGELKRAAVADPEALIGRYFNSLDGGILPAYQAAQALRTGVSPAERIEAGERSNELFAQINRAIADQVKIARAAGTQQEKTAALHAAEEMRAVLAAISPDMHKIIADARRAQSSQRKIEQRNNPAFLDAEVERIFGERQFNSAVNQGISERMLRAWATGPQAAILADQDRFLSSALGLGRDLSPAQQQAERDIAWRKLLGAGRGLGHAENLVTAARGTADYRDSLDKLDQAQQEYLARERDYQAELLRRRTETFAVPRIGRQYDAASGQLRWSLTRDAAGKVETETLGARDAVLMAGAYQGMFSPAVAAINRDRVSRGLGEKTSTEILGSFSRGMLNVDSLRPLSLMHQEIAKAMGWQNLSLKEQKERLNQIKGELREIVSVSRQVEPLTAQEHDFQRVWLADQALQQRRQQRMPWQQSARALSYNMGWMGAGFMVGMQLRSGFQEYRQFDRKLAEIRGVLPGMREDSTDALREAIATNSRKYGANLLEAASAAQELAQAGLNAQQIMQELDATLLAMRGMGMTVEQAQNLQIAIRAVEGDGANTIKVLEKISRVQAMSAVSSQDLAASLTILGPMAQQMTSGMSGVVDEWDALIGYSSVIGETLRITGKQTGTSLKFMLSRLYQPEILNKLQTQHGLNLGTAASGGRQMLPLPDLMAEIHNRFQQLGGADSQEAKMMLATLSGGRRVNEIMALMNNFERAQRLAMESQYAWGESQKRSALAMDTLDAQLNNLHTNITLWIASLAEGTGVMESFKLTIKAANLVLGGRDGTGGGAMGGVVATGAMLGGAALFKNSWRWLKDFRDVQEIARASGVGIGGTALEQVRTLRAVRAAGGVADAATISSTLANRGPAQGLAALWARMAPTLGRLGTVLTGVTTFLGPTLTLVAGGLLAAGGVGLLMMLGKWLHKKATEGPTVETYDRGSLRLFASPQYKDQEDLARGLGFETPQAMTETLAPMLTRPRMGSQLQALFSEYGLLTKEGELAVSKEKIADLGKQEVVAPDGQRTTMARLFRERFVAALHADLKVENPSALKAMQEYVEAAGEAETMTRLAALTSWDYNAALMASYHDLTAAAQEWGRTTQKSIDEIDWKNFEIGQERTRDMFRLTGGRASGAEARVRQAIAEMSGAGMLAGGNKDWANAYYDTFVGDDLVKEMEQRFRQEGKSGNALDILLEGQRRLEADPKKYQAAIETLAKTDYARLIKGSKVGEQTNLASDLSNMSLEEKAAEFERGMKRNIKAQIKYIEKYGKEQFRNDHPEAAQLEDLIEALNGNTFRATALAAAGLDGALVKLKSTLTDMLFSLYEGSQKIEAESKIAGLLGETYNAAEARLALGKQGMSMALMLPHQMELDIAKQEAAIQTLAEATGMDAHMKNKEGRFDPYSAPSGPVYEEMVKKAGKTRADGGDAVAEEDENAPSKVGKRLTAMVEQLRVSQKAYESVQKKFQEESFSILSELPDTKLGNQVKDSLLTMLAVTESQTASEGQKKDALQKFFEAMTEYTQEAKRQQRALAAVQHTNVLGTIGLEQERDLALSRAELNPNRGYRANLEIAYARKQADKEIADIERERDQLRATPGSTVDEEAYAQRIEQARARGNARIAVLRQNAANLVEMQRRELEDARMQIRLRQVDLTKEFALSEQAYAPTLGEKYRIRAQAEETALERRAVELEKERPRLSDVEYTKRREELSAQREEQRQRLAQDEYDERRRLAMELRNDRRDREERLGEMMAERLQANLRSWSTPSQRQAAREQGAQARLAAQLAALQRREGMTDAQKTQQAERLVYEQEVAEWQQKQLDLIQAQIDLEEQRRQTLGGMVSGLRTLFDFDAIGAMFRPDDGAIEQWGSKTAARLAGMRDMLYNVLRPIGDTYMQQVSSQMVETIVSWMSKKPLFQDLAEAPEAKLRNNLAEAAQGATSFESALARAAQRLDQFLAQAGLPSAESVAANPPAPNAPGAAAATQAMAAGAERGGVFTAGTVSPLDGAWVVTSRYGAQEAGRAIPHTGFDLDGKMGDPVRSMRGGRVLQVVGTDLGGHGKYVLVEQDDGYRALYGHLSGAEVKVGDTVRAGQLLGRMGNTGNVRAAPGGDGSHLHVEMWDQARNRIDPEAYLRARLAGDRGGPEEALSLEELLAGDPPIYRSRKELTPDTKYLGYGGQLHTLWREHQITYGGSEAEARRATQKLIAQGKYDSFITKEAGQYAYDLPQRPFVTDTLAALAKMNFRALPRGGDLSTAGETAIRSNEDGSNDVRIFYQVLDRLSDDPDLLRRQAAFQGMPKHLDPTPKGIVEFVAAHETGHAFAFQNSKAYAAAMRTAHSYKNESYPLYLEKLEAAGGKRGDTYASMDGREYFASLFANSLMMLRRTQAAPGSELREYYQLLDALPGSKEMVEQLLQHDLYKTHPLAKLLEQEEAPRGYGGLGALFYDAPLSLDPIVVQARQKRRGPFTGFAEWMKSLFGARRDENAQAMLSGMSSGLEGDRGGPDAQLSLEQLLTGDPPNVGGIRYRPGMLLDSITLGTMQAGAAAAEASRWSRFKGVFGFGKKGTEAMKTAGAGMQFANQLATMAGGMAGTAVGGGGKWASLGAQIGTMGGMLTPLGPVGGPIVGGIVGGLMGKLLDKKPDESPQLQGLQAIERAQRETIRTIEVQTDSLLKPESRLLNLPSTFTVPGYLPFGAGGAGGGEMGASTTIEKIEVNLSVGGNLDQITLAEVETVARRAVADAIHEGLSTGSRGVRR